MIPLRFSLFTPAKFVRLCGPSWHLFPPPQAETIGAVLRPSFLFLRKKHFRIDSNRYLALVLLREGEEPSMYMIPASAWSEPQPPFSSRDYEGLKSEPEYGLTISRETLQALEHFRFRGGVLRDQNGPPDHPSGSPA